MPLLPVEDFRELLRCPRCRACLEPEDVNRGMFVCSNSACSQHRNVFPTVGGVPVLIDSGSSLFDEAELSRSGGASYVQRRRSAVSIWLRRFLLGQNRVARRNSARFLDLAGKSATVLVVGGGSIGDGAGAIYVAPEVRDIAFDVYRTPYVQFLADAHVIPLADSSVDAVWVQAVLEHVLEPERVVREIVRVLRDGGVVYAETPFLQQVHEGAYDFLRFTERGHRWLFRRFECLDSGAVGGPGTQSLWTIAHLARGVFRSPMAGKVAKVAFFWLRWFDGIVPDRFALDSAAGVYFLGRRLSAEISPREVVDGYKGAQAKRNAS